MRLTPPAAGGAVGAPADVMTVSGRVAFDAFGRTIAQFYPVTDATSNDRTFDSIFDAVRPTKTAYDVLDRVISVQIPDDDVAPPNTPTTRPPAIARSSPST